MSAPPFPPMSDADCRLLRTLAIQMSSEAQDTTLERLVKRTIVELRRTRSELADARLVINRLQAELAAEAREGDRLRTLSQRRA